MTPLFKKLNFKGQNDISIINAPAEFNREVAAMQAEAPVNNIVGVCDDTAFVIVFVKTKREIEDFAAVFKKKLEGDPVIWFAYPKKTSKKYRVEINRDSGWESLRNIGLDTVRAVSVDDDWSALRLRRNEFIKR